MRGQDNPQRTLTSVRRATWTPIPSTWMEHLLANNKVEDAHREDERFFTNRCATHDFCTRVTRWIREAEHRLSEEVPASVAVSRRSAAQSVRSVKSARVHEEAKIAELKAESKSLDLSLQLAERKAALQAEEEKLFLQTELEVAEARRRAENRMSMNKMNKKEKNGKRQKQ